MFESLEDNYILMLYLLFIIPIMALYLWWMLNNNIYKKDKVWTIIVIIGMLYVLAASLVYSGYRMFASSLLILNFVLMIAISSVSELRNDQESSRFSLWCVGLTPLIIGLFFAGIASYIAYKTKKYKFEYQWSVR
jgi:hypothetical protein